MVRDEGIAFAVLSIQSMQNPFLVAFWIPAFTSLPAQSLGVLYSGKAQCACLTVTPPSEMGYSTPSGFSIQCEKLILLQPIVYLLVLWLVQQGMILILQALVRGVLLAAINKTLPELSLEKVQYPPEVYRATSAQEFTYTFYGSTDGQLLVRPVDPREELENQCILHSWSADFNLLASRPSMVTDDLDSKSRTWIYISSRKLIYSANSNLWVSVYSHLQDGTMEKQATIRLQRETSATNAAPPQLISSKDGRFLYVFVAESNVVFRIATSSLLGKIQPIKIEGADPNTTFLKAVSHSNHIYAIARGSNLVSGELKLVQTYQVSDRADNPPADLSSSNSSLFYVLGSKQNIYVYSIQSSKLTLHDTIQFSHSENMHIRVEEKRVYYSFYDKQQFAVAELFYDSTLRQATLVRYYRSSLRIHQFLIQNDTLMVLSFKSLDLYPVNIDPRLIKRQYNGVHHSVNGHSILHLNSGHYLLVSNSHLELYRIAVRSPHFTCRITKNSLFLNIVYTGVSKFCQSKKASKSLPFNHGCNFTRSIRLELIEPEEHSTHQSIFYFMVGVFGFLLVLGCWLLKKWIEERLQYIGQLQKKIDEMAHDDSVMVREEISVEESDKQQSPKTPNSSCRVEYLRFQQEEEMSKQHHQITDVQTVNGDVE